MKLVLLPLAVFAIALASAQPHHRIPFPRGLKEDLHDFIALIPQNDVTNIIVDYIANDEQVQETLEYILSDDFKILLTDIENIKEYRLFLQYLQDSGLNVYYYLNKLHDFVGLPEFQPRSAHRTMRRGKGVRGMLNDIEALIPTDKFKALYYEKLDNSPAFFNLVNRMSGDEFKGVIKQLGADPKFQELVQRAKDQGVDIELIRDVLNKIFGWGLQRKQVIRSLHDDFYDFLALVPKDEVATIAFDYLANDEEVQEVFEFIQSEEFKTLVTDVDKVPEYIQFLNFLQKSGLNVYEYVNKLHEMLEIPTLTPPATKSLNRRGKGVRGLIDEIKAILPIDEIKALFYKKLETSPDFANLVNTMRGEEFKKMILRLEANPTFQEIIARAKKHGVDIKLIVDLLNKIFGWGIEDRRSLY